MTARVLAKGHRLNPRDLLVMAAYGRIGEVSFPDGTVLRPRRDVYPNPQTLVDDIARTLGCILIRADPGWVGLLPGADGKVLQMKDGLPNWEMLVAVAYPEHVDAAEGDIVYFNGTTWQPLRIGDDGEWLTIVAGEPSWRKVTTGGVLLGRATAGAGPMEEIEIATLLDAYGDHDAGTLVYRGDTAWETLAPGVSGQVLSTQGVGLPPLWIDAPTGGGGGGPAPFGGPTDIPGIALWLDFTDASTITLNSGKIASINDKSPLAHHASQSNSSFQPTWGTSAPSGKHTYTAASGNAWLDTDSFSLPQPFTIAICGKFENVGAYFCDSPSGTRVAVLAAGDIHVGSFGFYLFGWWGSGDANGDLTTNDINVPLTAVTFAHGAGSQMWINGVQRGTTGQGPATGGITAGLRIGANQSTGFQLQGWMTHFIVYDRELTSVERAALEGWLVTDSGI